MSTTTSSHRPGLLALGFVFAALVGGLAWGAGLPVDACATAAITALCAAYWVTEALPIPATSMLPFALLPMAGVLTAKDIAGAYGHDLILLLLGGFMLSTALERNGAHRRLALGMLRLIGAQSRRRVVVGFVATAGLLSMWMSNTATTLMLLPVALAVAEGAEDDRANLEAPLFLGVAWASSIGGLGTPIGTPPNLVLMGLYEEMTGQTVSFVQWMRWGVPSVLVLLPLAAVVLTWGLREGAPLRLPQLGPWAPKERRVLALFVLTALAWITRSTPDGGWAGLLGLPGVSDATVALAAVGLMFFVPDGEGGPILDWDSAERIPWGLLLLFGGGIAIADAFVKTGLSASLGALLSPLASYPAVVPIAALCLGVTFLTEVTSNTATATLLMPITYAAAIAAGLDPLVLMVPAALSASCAFMLPVATAPNAVVFGTGRVPMAFMVRRGLALNFLAAAALVVICLLLVP
ncbi:MAG: hypothetical protein RIT28_1615 [Pseudomonadota bacterium]